MQTFDDLKYSLRLLRKTPGFTATTLIVIVLSLGLFLAAFTFGNMLAHEPMPFPNGDDYVRIRAVDAVSSDNLGLYEFDNYFLNRLNESSSYYSEIGAENKGTFVFSDGEFAQSYLGTSISLNLFTALAFNPMLGRNFTLEDASPGADRVVMLSERLWRDYYATDPQIVGKSAEINGDFYTVIGVMAEQFTFPRNSDLWVPLSLSDTAQPGEGLPLSLIGILDQDISYAEATAEITALLTREAETFPDYYGNRVGLVYDYSDTYALTPIQLPLVLNITTLLILAVAVVNLSSLLFIRSSSRQQELVVRSSLGANGWQLSKQVLLESFIICFVGLVLSLLTSAFLLRLLQATFINLSFGYNQWFTFALDGRSYLAGIGSIVIIWLVSCSLVVIKAFHSNPGDVLEASNKGADGARIHVMTRIVVGFELILSCFLLICCGAIAYLLAQQAANTDYGANTEDIAVAPLNFTHIDYDTEQSRIAYLEQLGSAISELPGTIAVSTTSALPHLAGRAGTFQVDGFNEEREAIAAGMSTVWVDNSYFETVEVDLLEGRQFDSSDTATSDRVTIIGDDIATLLWPDESAIGKEIRITEGDEVISLRVVGVIPKILQSISSLNTNPTLYRPMFQDMPRNVSLVVKHRPQTNLTDLQIAIRTAATGIDRNLPIESIRSLENQITVDQEAINVIASVFMIFALAMLLLASIGIYAVMARSIQLRTGEIGVRRALGSTNFRIAWKFARQSINFLFVSTALGGGLACLAMFAMMVSLGLTDLSVIPVLVAVVAAIMSVVVLTATWIPAHRAVAMEPGDALRYE